MGQGKPVVVSNSQTLMEFVQEHGCGVWYVNHDPGALASSLRSVASESTMRLLGRRGRAAIETRLNWELEAEKLVDFVDSIVEEARRCSKKKSE